MHSVSSEELPPPPPRACFGRDELIEKIVGLAENLTPIALIGPGGIGKTSIALTVLHHDRIKQRFGDNRRFIRCDQFPASPTHFLSRLSKAFGGGAENLKDLAPLRSFLSSREIILFLDSAESILDPQGTGAREIYTMVEELSQFTNICLCITSRVPTIPLDCRRLDIPTLSMDAACRTFYRIYDDDERSDRVDDILGQLGFHPLSITLLATVAHHNKWGTDRLAREWEDRHMGVLHAQNDGTLATTIELSLASPTFRELGPDARDLLGVVAFFPRGINENNLDWLFPNIPDRTNIFDKFCALSLTYRSNGFIAMLAPLRDHLRPENPMSSPLLRTTKDHYFRRLSVDVYPDKPGYEEARWIMSEDVNVEHLLDVSTSIDTTSVDVWAACCNFMEHLSRHKPRLVVFRPKIEGLPDDHPSKPPCLFALSRLFFTVGNYAEEKRLLVRALRLWRERRDNPQVAQMLMYLAVSNGLLGLHDEGVRRGEEALEIYKRLDDVLGQAHSSQFLAWALSYAGRLDAAEQAASRALNLLPSKGEQFRVCQCHRALGNIYHFKGRMEKAIDHLKTALGIASSFNWHDQLFWIHYSLAELSSKQGRSDDARSHIELARSHAINTPYHLGRAMFWHAGFWSGQNRLKEAMSEALGAADIFERLGATKDLENCKPFIRNIEIKMKSQNTSGELGFDGQPLETVLPPTPTNSPSSDLDHLAGLLRRILT